MTYEFPMGSFRVIKVFNQGSYIVVNVESTKFLPLFSGKCNENKKKINK